MPTSSAGAAALGLASQGSLLLIPNSPHLPSTFRFKVCVCVCVLTGGGPKELFMFLDLCGYCPREPFSTSQRCSHSTNTLSATSGLQDI